MSNARDLDAGLSLIEVLVSLAIFAVIGVAGLAVLNTVARTGEQTEGRLERLAQIDRAFLVIRRDLAQITGAEVTLERDGIAFRRADQNSSIAIAYKYDNSALIRQVERPAADTVDQELLDDIDLASWRLLDRAQRWHEVWPPAGPQSPGRPMAAELTLEFPHPQSPEAQTVTRLITLPAGQSR